VETGIQAEVDKLKTSSRAEECEVIEIINGLSAAPETECLSSPIFANVLKKPTRNCTRYKYRTASSSEVQIFFRTIAITGLTPQARKHQTDCH